LAKKEDFVTKIKTLTGATSSELTIVFTLLVGLILGAFLKTYIYGEQDKKLINKEVFRLLDSLAEASRLSYSDIVIKTNVNLLDSTYNNFETSNIELAFNGNKKQTKAEKIAGKKFNINTASKSDLMKLPWVGEKTADKIIEYRNNKKFQKISDIKNIKGIGDKKFESMKEFITIE